jgi:hypothetical protein
MGFVTFIRFTCHSLARSKSECLNFNALGHWLPAQIGNDPSLIDTSSRARRDRLTMAFGVLLFRGFRAPLKSIA